MSCTIYTYKTPAASLRPGLVSIRNGPAHNNPKGKKLRNKRKRITKVLRASAVLVFLFPFFVGAATTDDFIRGYSAAVLEREFQIKDYSLEVLDGTVRVTSGELKNLDTARLMTGLFAVQGVKRVELLDSQGDVIASSTTPPQASTTTSKDKPAYELGFLPGGNLFQPLMADPRWPHFSIAYENYIGDPELKNVGAVSFGETFALYRNHAPLGGLWEVGFQGGIFSIFDLDAPSSDLVNTDFVGGITASYRLKDFSTFFRIFHQSSHLGDEFILRNRINRINLSFEGVDLKLSYRLFDWLRLYTGGTYLFDVDPSDLKRWASQGGLELQTPWRFWADSARLVAAVDLQNRQENSWSTEISVRSGLQFERPQNFMRNIQLLIEYYKGHSPNGQFFDRKIEYVGPGLHLHF
jgi:Protein of unknown function (DUF1207)